MRKTVKCALGLALLCAATAQASTKFFDFNTDPITSGELTLYGNGVWQSTGGVGSATNANDGYLQVTAAVNSQRSAIVFADFDAGLIVQGFTFEADFQMGNALGCSGVPADGFSVNYVRANDPVLSVVAASGDPSSASTDPNPPTGAAWIGHGVWATGPNCEDNLPEEGSWTGISIGFDAWNSGGSAPFCYEAAQSIGADIVGVDIRVDGILVQQTAMTTLNGSVTDPTSMQTGPNDGTGTTAPLGWAHLKVDLSASGVLNVWWKGSQILNNYQTSYFPSAGRLVFAGRTGGCNQNQNVDNIAITTLPATHPIVGLATGYPDGASVQITDSGFFVDITKPYSLQVNGATVPATISKAGAVTTVAWHGYPALLVSGSTTNAVTVTVTDSSGATDSGTRAFTVSAYSIVNAAWAVTGVDTTKPGFRMKTWQSSLEPNNIWWANEQLAGLHGTNQADTTSFIDGGYVDFTIATSTSGMPDMNMDYASNNDGNFTAANGYPENNWPGLSSGNNGLAAIDDCAADIPCFLKFPAAGVYWMGVNSDDGFALTTGPNPADWGALMVGSYNGGRGASDSIFPFVVTNAGIYPFRLMWENGTGGANCEWFNVLLANGALANATKVLMNDPSPTNNTGVVAYYAGPALPAYVSWEYPTPGSTIGDPVLIAASITDGATTFLPAGVQFYVNGSALTPSVSPKVSGVTTVTAYILPPLGPLATGSSATAQLVYSTSGGGPFTNTWTYTVVGSYSVLNAAWAVTGVDTTKPGFRLRPWQSGAQPNDNWWTEEQLAGLYGDNNVDPTLLTDHVYGQGYADYTGVINFDISGQNGNFQTSNDYADLPFPGIPAANGLTGSASLEALCYLYCDHPGLYTMGVNSDDGFKVTAGANPADWITSTLIGQLSGGRSASSSSFSFLVTNAGYYPFRLIYENGNGELPGNGASLEWYMVEPAGAPVLINDPRTVGEFGNAQAFFLGPLLPAFVSLAEPNPGASGVRPDHLFQVNLTDGLTKVTPASIRLSVNGVTLNPVISHDAATGITTAQMPAPYLLPPGSDTATLVYTTTGTGGGTFTATWNFTVLSWGGLNPAWAVTGVDTSKAGFLVRPWKSSGEPNAGQPNDLRWTEEQMVGAHGNNRADLSLATDNGYIDYASSDVNHLINWNNQGQVGDFQSPNYTDIPFPGSGNQYYWDNSAEEVVCYLYFNVPGLYGMGVNSDDGFSVKAGANPKDWFAPLLGYYEGGRGSSDTLFFVNVTNTGYYPIRLLWQNGGGGFNCEWFYVAPNGTKVLINDPNPPVTVPLNAYYAGPKLPAYVAEYWPADGATGVSADDVSFVLQDGSTTVTPGSIALSINGTAITPVVTSAGGVTKVSLPGPLPAGSTNTVLISYTTSGGGSFSQTWSFVVSTWQTVTLSTNLWTPPGSGTNAGFAMKVHQNPNTNIFNNWRNLIRMADMALQGLYGPSVAVTTQYTNNGEMWWPGVINFSQDSGGARSDNGSLQSGDGFADVVVPGLGLWTPTTTANKMDNDAFQARTFLEFPTAGPYVMGVNSDDCFRVTVGDQGAPGKSPLSILAPASVAGEITAMYNTVDDQGNNLFGVTPPSTVPLIGRAVLCDPINASSVPVNASAIAGNIAVCYRGANFQTQSRRCFAAGAIAVIGGDYTTDATLPGIRGNADSNPDPAIPCLQIAYPDFQRLTNNITQDASSPVVVRITAQDCSAICGKYDNDNGRGASDTLFTVQVPEPGVYPFRLVWENGGGDANCEWFVIDPVTGIRTLINDAASPVKAWINRNVNAAGALPAPKMSAPTLSGGQVIISWTGEGELWESYSLNGPWFKSTYQSNPSAVSPSPFTPASYFRVRQY